MFFFERSIFKIKGTLEPIKKVTRSIFIHVCSNFELLLYKVIIKFFYNFNHQNKENNQKFLGKTEAPRL